MPDTSIRERALVARKELFELCLKDIRVTKGVDVASLASMSEGYSGADIHLVCREASMMPLRKLQERYSTTDLANMKQQGTLELPFVTPADLKAAISNQRPSVGKDQIRRFEKFDNDFGTQ